VVISVIMILMGILMPVLQSAQAKGKEIKCISNLGQIGKGFAAYRISYRAFMPSPAFAECMIDDATLNDPTLYDGGPDSNGNPCYPWRGKLLPYIGNVSENDDERYAIMKCPAVRDFKGRRSFYGFNAYAGMATNPEGPTNPDTNLPKYLHIEDFQSPSETLLIGENNTGHWAVRPVIPKTVSDFTDASKDANSTARHSKRGAWAYADGHTEPLRILQSEERQCYRWMLAR
jgi:prepilin-type processing-associated H-X9-DG protein